MPSLTLAEFLAELSATAKIYPFGFSIQHYREETDCGGQLLRRHYVLHCLTGITRPLDPVEAVHFRHMHVDKDLPMRRVAHPRDAGVCIGLPAELVDRIIASATQAWGGEDRLRALLLRACNVGFDQALAASAKWRVTIPQEPPGEITCQRQLPLNLRP